MTEMQTFLRALEPDSTVPHIFVLISGQRVRTLWGFADDSTEAMLRQLNDDGWNIFFAINGFSCWAEGKVWVKQPKNYLRTTQLVDAQVPWADGQSRTPSRRAYAMDIPRAVYVDVDNPDAPGGANGKWPAHVPLPSITVESSPGKRQHYWLLDKANATHNRGHQRHDNKALVAALGGDPSAVDPARVLRVPGFVNRKYATEPVAKILVMKPQRFTLPILSTKKATPPPQRPVAGGVGWLTIAPDDTESLLHASVQLERLKYALGKDVLLFGADPAVKALGRGSDTRIYKAANAVLDWLVNTPPHKQVDAVYAFLEPWFLAAEGDSPQKGDKDYLRMMIEHALTYRQSIVGGHVSKIRWYT